VRQVFPTIYGSRLGESDKPFDVLSSAISVSLPISAICTADRDLAFFSSNFDFDNLAVHSRIVPSAHKKPLPFDVTGAVGAGAIAQHDGKILSVSSFRDACNMNSALSTFRQGMIALPRFIGGDHRKRVRWRPVPRCFRPEGDPIFAVR
jgi:hypothetical protein